MNASATLKQSFSKLGIKLAFIHSFALLSFITISAVYSAQVASDRGIGGIAPLAQRTVGTSWAVVIGINAYDKAPRLNYAVNDAKSVVASLPGLGFPSDKILLLLDQEATKQRIQQLLYGTLRRTNPDDRVFVFFAGHGLHSALPRGGEEGFLLPVDGDPEDLPLTAIAMEDLRRIARRIPAKHVLFTVDACYSGFAITRDAATGKVDDKYLEAVSKEPAVQIITAGRKGEQVLEEEGHGLFTRRLLSGLSGLADPDQKGFITAQELATWVESRVARDSQDRQRPQYGRLDGEGQFVFRLTAKQALPGALARDGEDGVSEEMLQLHLERSILEDQRKLYEEKLRLELAALQAERALLKTEFERTVSEKVGSNDRGKEYEWKKSEETVKIELTAIESERARLKLEEERLIKERTRAEATWQTLERRRKEEARQSQAVAKVAVPLLPARFSAIPTGADLPKYNVGDSWTVKFADGRTSTRKIRSVENDQYIFEWGLDLLRYFDGSLALTKQITPEDGREFPSVMLKQRTMDFPLTSNKSWDFEISHGMPSSLNDSARSTRYSRKFRFKVLNSEVVSTPAGNLGAFKIEERSHEMICWAGPCNPLPNSTVVRHWWYAPEVKFPVKVQHVSGAFLPGEEPEYELVAFDLK